MGSPPVFFPPVEGKADPAITTALHYLTSLSHQLQVQPSSSRQFLTRAEAEQKYSPAVLRKLLQTGGAFFLNVHDLPGVLAQPQNAGAPTGAATPSLQSPLSQNGALFLVTPGVTLFFFDGSSAPGTWKAVTTTAVGHNILSLTHPDTLAAAVVRGDLIVGNASPAWSRLPIGANKSFLRSGGTDPAWVAINSQRSAATAIAAGPSVTAITITWSPAFADANYTVTLGLEITVGALTGSSTLYPAITARVAGSITVSVVNLLVTDTFTVIIHATATHD